MVTDLSIAANMATVKSLRELSLKQLMNGSCWPLELPRMGAPNQGRGPEDRDQLERKGVKMSVYHSGSDCNDSLDKR